MSPLKLKQETYLPDPNGPFVAIHAFLRGHHPSADSDRSEPSCFLVSSVQGDRVELPPTLHHVLEQVVEALERGFAVTVVPTVQRLTTQQAADLLGVSRPTVVKVLDQGRIPFERVGTHRRVLLRDLLAYREERRVEQYAALEATAVAIDDDDDLDLTMRQLRDARRVVAARRRAPSAR